MKAVMLIPGPEGGRIEVQDAPQPTPGPRDVLIKVKATAINRGEVVGRRGLKTGDPVISGIELAGEVEKTGVDAGSFKVGDRVMGQVRGCNADFAVADRDLLMPVPDHLDWVQAASLPNVLVTAHDAIVTNGVLTAGETVLVNAGSSGIGIAAIQIARALGAGTIIATSRGPEKLAALEALGADVRVDLSSESIIDAVAAATDGKGVDLIIDSVGAPALADNIEVLGLKGRLIGVGRLGGSMAEIDLNAVALKRLRIIGVTFRTRNDEEKRACARACAADLQAALSDGAIQPVVDRVFPIEELDAAHRYMESNAHTGKIVITL
ncbi:MAG: zinc-binding dehydrogenase [Rhodospirillaceae bacterium]|nr:zinc-binding dehydrogenase [Rhodospirillaceae bacterium]MBT5811994.1 zinc-binding dehydrogenase [Rhodospirillaceae bacterium]